MASQNTMAALVGGATVHKWGTIPICSEKAMEKMQGGGKKDATISELFVSCTGMRWLIVDEVSTLSTICCAKRKAAIEGKEDSKERFGFPKWDC